MRSVLVLLSSALSAVALASAASGAAELLPDLDPEAPVRPYIVQAPDGSGTAYLTFNAAFANVGSGPLVLRGNRASVEEPTMVADQVVKLDDGSETIRPAVGTFAYDDELQRWGAMSLITYELRPLGGEVVARGPDVGFCVIDTRAADPRRALPGQPAQKVFRDCGRGRPGRSRLTVEMGTSVGWANWHKAGNKGQLIDATSLPSGRYVLKVRVNGGGTIAEESMANNASSVLISITSSDGGLPRIELLRECPNSGKCKPLRGKRSETR